MSDQDSTVLSPTVLKVLDEFLVALTSDGEVADETAQRLDGILRSGKLPKPEDIDAALQAPKKGECS